MREITKEMIKLYKIKKVGCDFMGYEFDRPEQLTFHHLIIPKCESKANGIGEGYVMWNGAILTQDYKHTDSHDYLHLIERYDRDIFDWITLELIEENMSGHICMANLERIRDALVDFEREYCSERDRKGKLIIKEDYIKRRVLR